jgi:hypothetical protein
MRLLESGYRSSDRSKFSAADGDLFLWGRKKRFLGLAIGDQVVALDFKHFFSFRVQMANVLSIPYRVYCCKRTKPAKAVEYVKHYLTECDDNPYAVWNVILNLSRGDDVENQLTEYRRWRSRRIQQCTAKGLRECLSKPNRPIAFLRLIARHASHDLLGELTEECGRTLRRLAGISR